MAKNKSEILRQEGEENLSVPLDVEFKPELKEKNIEVEKREYTIELITAKSIIAVDKNGNGADFPKEDFINPKVGDKFTA
jgi:hypothetical protein